MSFTRTLAVSALALVLSGGAIAQSAGPGLTPPPNSPKAPSANEAAPAPAPAAAPAKKKMTRAQRKAARAAAKAAKDPNAAATPGMTPNPGRDSSGALPLGATKGDGGAAGTGSGNGKP
jgi:hypothetical protein